jgi:hypothetical protein
MNTFKTSNQLSQDIIGFGKCGTTPVDDTKRNTVSADHGVRFQPVKLRRLLVPLDGSAFGERALPLAVDIARRAGAELQLVHVDTTYGHPYTRNRLVQDEIDSHYCDERKWHKRGYVERVAA